MPKCVNGGWFIANHMKDFFLDDFSSVNAKDGKEAIIRLMASDVLGEEQYEKLELRYYDMFRNYDCVTKEALGSSRYKGSKPWDFSNGIMPHKRNNRPYSDTTAIPIPISHYMFKEMRAKLIKEKQLDGAVVGLDLPTWFNLSSSDRLMIVAQDPLRNPKWYYECNAAICSSPFGQHDRVWRENGRGGKRVALMINALVAPLHGYGVYLTDAYKYYLCGWKNNSKYRVGLAKDTDRLQLYQDILNKEIEIVRPKIIVTLGGATKKVVETIVRRNDVRILSLPHFSGSAQGYFLSSETYGRIKSQLRLKDNSIESQAAVFAYAIINNLEL